MFRVSGDAVRGCEEVAWRQARLDRLLADEQLGRPLLETDLRAVDGISPLSPRNKDNWLRVGVGGIWRSDHFLHNFLCFLKLCAVPADILFPSLSTSEVPSRSLLKTDKSRQMESFFRATHTGKFDLGFRILQLDICDSTSWSVDSNSTFNLIAWPKFWQKVWCEWVTILIAMISERKFVASVARWDGFRWGMPFPERYTTPIEFRVNSNGQKMSITTRQTTQFEPLI